ncbi:MAG TPA: SPOR domain-containing protein [Steroidobacteraceae bacterium]|nr:SPOR domain-containing protein [Steroidobacteraceae bacterium]
MRFTYRAAGPIAAAAVLTLLAGCSRVQLDWQAAQQAGTAQAYHVFVARHPGSELAGVARQRIAQLTEEAVWEQAIRTNTAAAYQDYLAKYPNGSWSQDARIRMESRSLAAQPSLAAPPAEGRAAGMPSPSEPVIARGSAPGSDGPNASGAAIQLGAFSSIANAHSAWNQLSSRFQVELRGLTPLTVPVMSSGRRLYRLEARVTDEAAGRRLCHQLQQHSQGCLPLP